MIKASIVSLYFRDGINARCAAKPQEALITNVQWSSLSAFEDMRYRTDSPSDSLRSCVTLGAPSSPDMLNSYCRQISATLIDIARSKILDFDKISKTLESAEIILRSKPSGMHLPLFLDPLHTTKIAAHEAMQIFCNGIDSVGYTTTLVGWSIFYEAHLAILHLSNDAIIQMLTSPRKYLRELAKQSIKNLK